MEETKEISTLNIKESFLMLTQYLDDKEEYNDLEETYEQVRFGKNIRFDIYDYINEMVKVKDKSGLIIYRGKTINLTKFWTELEERNIIAKKWLKTNTTEESNIDGYEIPKKTK